MKRLIPLLLLVAGCDDRPRQWDLVVYPNQDDLTAFDQIKGFTTFDQCRAAADYVLKLKAPDGGGTFERGYMCRYDPVIQTNVCKETRD